MKRALKCDARYVPLFPCRIPFHENVQLLFHIPSHRDPTVVIFVIVVVEYLCEYNILYTNCLGIDCLDVE